MTKEEIRKSDFRNGVQIDSGVVCGWILEAIEEVRKGSSHFSISSGNSRVMAKEVVLSHDPENPIVEVIQITSGYMRYEYPLNRKPTNNNEIIEHECIGFAEWAIDNDYYWEDDELFGKRWFQDNYEPNVPILTTKELYQLYLKSKQLK